MIATIMPATLPLLVLIGTLVTKVASGQPTEVFTSGTEGYHTFRIPALITTGDGTLLAFAEGRRGGRGDAGDIDLVLRRSTDGGATWGPLAVIWDDEANTCGNPCPVLDRTTGIIHLLMTRNLGTDTEPEIINQTSEEARSVWTCTSDDHGLTWTTPREITATAKDPSWTWYATGPGNGIQLRSGEHAGRLIIPCDHIEAGTKKYFSHVIVSDDHGKTWRIAGRTPTDQVNECAVAELDDGTLLLNMRNYDRSKRSRALTRSSDGGETWSVLTRHPELPEPICQASMIAIEGGRRLVFSNPASPNGRVAMTVKESRDGGRSWTTIRQLHAGPAAYSSLAATGEHEIACLYEAGEKSPYESIRFQTLPVASPDEEKSD